MDLILSLLGITLLYISLGYLTAWVASWWTNEKVLLYVNGFLTQGIFFVLVYAILKTRKHRWRDLGFIKMEFRTYFGSVMSLYLLSWLINIMYSIYLFQKGFTPPETDVYTKLLGDVTYFTFFLNFILAGILAPIIEETLFRGFIFGSLQTYLGRWTSAIISAVIFSALHFQAYGFLPRFALGMILAYLYMKHKSIYPSIALHSVNNTVALLLSAWVQ